jgi:thioredoxin 1
LVDFYGQLCAPCKLQRPVLEELAQELPQLKFCLFCVDFPAEPQDVDATFAVLEHYHVMDLPTLLLLNESQVLAAAIGLHSKEELLAMLEQHGVL